MSLRAEGWGNILSTKGTCEGVGDECLKHKDKIESAKFNHGSFMNYIGHGIYPIQPEVDEKTSLQQMKARGGHMTGEDEACQGLLR